MWVRLAKGPPDTALPACDQELPGAASTLEPPHLSQGDPVFPEKRQEAGVQTAAKG